MTSPETGSLNATISNPATDMILSPDGSRLYISNGNGGISVYDVATRAFVEGISLGQAIAGIDISPDGTYLVAVAAQPGSFHAATDQRDAYTTDTIFRIDVSTHAVTDFQVDLPPLSYPIALSDIAALDDGSAIATQDGSNRTVVRIDLSSGNYSVSGPTFGGYAGVLSAAADHSEVIYTGVNQSDSPIAIFDADHTPLYRHDSYQDDVEGYPDGITAVTLSGNLSAQHTYAVSPTTGQTFSSIFIYDAHLNYKFDLVSMHPEFADGHVAGLAFNSDGSDLFVLDADNNQIVEISTSNWRTVRTFNVGFDIGTYADGAYGNRLLITPDSQYFLVQAANGVQEIANDEQANNFQGSSDNDVLSGGLGDDRLDGLAGNDVLDGGSGDDVLDGDTGNDTVTYASATAGVTVNLSITVAQDTGGAGSDALISIENLTGSAYDDTLRGNTGDNVLNGGAGNDYLDGGDGNDVIDGGNGNDTIRGGGAGMDVMHGGNGDDTIVVDRASDIVAGELYDGGSGNDTLILNFNTDGDLSGVTLTGIETLDQSYFGYDTKLTAAQLEALRGVSGQSFTLTTGGAVHMAGVTINADAFNLSDAGNSFDLTGSTQQYLITVNGGAGNDTITGGTSADTLNGGGGSDVLAGAGGDDTLDGGDGIDTASYARAGSAVTVSLAVTGAQATGGAGSDTLTNIENLTGSNFNDSLTGDAGANVLSGGIGNDILSGGAGDDTLNGGGGYDRALYADAAAGVTIDLNSTTAQATGSSGMDTLTGIAAVNGSNFDDVLTGDAHNNELKGGIGNDVLTGGGGNDTLNGGAGTDTADYSGAGVGVHVNLSTTIAQNTQVGSDTLISIEGLTGSAFNDILTGSSVANTLSGGDGIDRLDGGLGKDTLTGGAGTDRFFFTTTLGSTNIDTITDFTAGQDKIYLDHNVFAGLTAGALAAGAFYAGTAAHDADDRIIYNGATGALLFDSDGTGGTAAVQFATLSTGLSLGASSFQVA